MHSELYRFFLERAFPPAAQQISVAALSPCVTTTVKASIGAHDFDVILLMLTIYDAKRLLLQDEWHNDCGKILWFRGQRLKM
ncbi:MAG: hypothetical protein KatS3mg114_1262 [Planctomycetaceae bacterium]|nr:MAG: hypothetical protein KatS3mg114_1262 [Planctomycetaceae bacterium]